MSNNGWKVGDNAPNSVQIDDLKELVGIPELQEEVNGKAEVEHTHEWDDIYDLPTTFPPSSHSHNWDSIADKPLTFTPSSHDQSWSTIKDTPSEYPPSSHTHDWSDIENTPSTFPVNAHTHAISGVVDLEDELNKRTTKRILTYTLTTNASGVASVTYATPFSAVPNVHLDLTPSDSIRKRVRITSSTATGFSIIAEQQDTALLSLLGVDILTASASVISGATVRATVIESA